MRDREGDGAAIDGTAHRADEAAEGYLERAADIGLGDDQRRDQRPEAVRQMEERGESEGGKAGRRHAQHLDRLWPVLGQPVPCSHRHHPVPVHGFETPRFAYAVMSIGSVCSARTWAGVR